MPEEEEAKSDKRIPNEHLPKWVLAFPDEEASKRENWPPRAKDREIDWDHPTFEVYFDPEYADFTPDFKQARQKLDYSYHLNPAKSRQELQDAILSRVVQAATTRTGIVESDSSSEQKEEEKGEIVMPTRRPWIIFSAGSMGVGKGYVLSKLNERGLFPLDQLLHIDPDMIKTELPEMSGYLHKDAASAATKVHRESTQMADILLEHALQSRLPTLVDGSLRDVDYYRSLMKRIRQEFPEYQLAILHVTASPEIIRSRAQSRAQKTGRAVPEKLLEESIEQVPKSVAALSPYVDVSYTISNEDNQPIQLVKTRHGDKDVDKDDEDTSWKDFRDTWFCNIDECSEMKKEMLRRLPSWHENQCPGVCKMSLCWKDKKCIQDIKTIFSSAYPSFCPGCTLGGDTQCGICIHDVHWCSCPECGPSRNNPISGCPLANMFSEGK